MPSLFPSNVGKPGRKGLVPARGCGDGGDPLSPCQCGPDGPFLPLSWTIEFLDINNNPLSFCSECANIPTTYEIPWLGIESGSRCVWELDNIPRTATCGANLVGPEKIRIYIDALGSPPFFGRVWVNDSDGTFFNQSVFDGGFTLSTCDDSPIASGAGPPSAICRATQAQLTQ